jgi:hypothetical protein
MSRGSVNTAIGMMDQCASFWLPCCDRRRQRRNRWFCPQMRLQRPADTGFADCYTYVGDEKYRKALVSQRRAEYRFCSLVPAKCEDGTLIFERPSGGGHQANTREDCGTGGAGRGLRGDGGARSVADAVTCGGTRVTPVRGVRPHRIFRR